MGFQFVHVEAYARKASTKISNRKAAAAKKAGREAVSERRSMREIIAEAEREPGNHPHVENPQPPALLFGVMPHEVEREAHAWCDQNRDARGRAMRADGLCLAAGVVSAPDGLTPQQWDAIKRDVLEWLKSQYGERLRSVVEHTDERYPHLHFYALPKPGEKFEAVDPGRAAAKKAADAGEVKGAQNNAYKAAMREFQDSFFNAVAVRHGLTRLGPARRRLTRGEWRAEQQQAQAAAQATAAATHASQRAAEIAAEAQRRAREAVEAQEAARRAQEEARRVELEARRVQEESRRAELEARRVEQEAEQRRIAAVAEAKEAQRQRDEAQQQAALAETFAAPIEERAKKLKAGEEALEAERTRLKAERGTLRTEQTRLRVQREALVRRERRLRGLGRAVGVATRSVVQFARWATRPLRDRRQRRELEDLEARHEAELAEARRSSRASGRADVERETKQEIKALKDDLQKYQSDAKSLRKQLGLPEEGAESQRHDLTVKPRAKKIA